MTGALHLGGIRTLLYNYYYAKQHNGEIYLRIEDTDRKRYVPEAEDYIQRAMKWMGIEFDSTPWSPDERKGPYRQSERHAAGIYTKWINKLIDSGMAYYAFDTPEDLELARTTINNFKYNHETRAIMKNSLSLDKDVVEKLLKNNVPHTIRFKAPVDGTVSWDDMIRGTITFKCSELDDKVIVKADGIPTYHLANIVDDALMGTTHVIRGEEWISSCPLHILIYQSLGFSTPLFAHLPLILDTKGRKLSKRNADKLGIPVFPLTWEGEEGYEKYEVNAFINYISMLGWTPKNEISSLSELIHDFDINRVNKAGAKYNLEKLNWINSQWINREHTEEIWDDIYPNDSSGYTHDEKKKIISFAKERAVFKDEIKNVTDIFVLPIKEYVNIKNISPEFIDVFKDWSFPQDLRDYDGIKKSIVSLCEDKDVKPGKVLRGLREALCGGKSGPELMSTMHLLGSVESKNRIDKAIKAIESI